MFHVEQFRPEKEKATARSGPDAVLRETPIKSQRGPSVAKAAKILWRFTDDLKAVPFERSDLIRVSLAVAIGREIGVADDGLLRKDCVHTLFGGGEIARPPLRLSLSRLRLAILPRLLQRAGQQ